MQKRSTIGNNWPDNYSENYTFRPKAMAEMNDFLRAYKYTQVWRTIFSKYIFLHLKTLQGIDPYQAIFICMILLKKSILYIGLIIVFGGLIFYLLHKGAALLDHSVITRPPAINMPTCKGRTSTNLFHSNLDESLPRLLFQIIIIIAATQLLGSAFKKIGQRM